MYTPRDNHPPANIRSVADQLSRGGEAGNTVAGLMLEQLSRRATKENP